MTDKQLMGLFNRIIEAHKDHVAAVRNTTTTDTSTDLGLATKRRAEKHEAYCANVVENYYKQFGRVITKRRVKQATYTQIVVSDLFFNMQHADLDQLYAAAKGQGVSDEDERNALLEDAETMAGWLADLGHKVSATDLVNDYMNRR